MLTHNDSTALQFSAEQVFLQNDTATSHLRNRCLIPGMYARHLQRWFDYFTPLQLILIDGKQLRIDPQLVISLLYAQLKLPADSVNLSKSLRFVAEKGFYCAVKGKTQKLKCLGQNKGRKYSAMTDKLRNFLTKFYAPYNDALSYILTYYKFSLPYFLT